MTVKITHVCMAVLFFSFVRAGLAQDKDSPMVDKNPVVETHVDEEFTFSLDSNPTTGYQWQVDGAIDEKIIRFVKSEYRPNETDLIGAGGKEYWTFKAVGEGQTNVSFKYVRPWEKDVPPVKKDTFEVMVTSKEGSDDIF